MFRRVLLGSAVVLFFFSINAFSQAAAESALTHSASGAAAAKGGSALGGALNKAFQKSGSAMANSGQAASQQAPPAQSAGATAAPDASSIPTRAAVQDASLVQFSLRGSGTNCPAPLDWKHRQQPESSDDNNLTVCGLHASAGPFPKTKYKPVVEIEF